MEQENKFLRRLFRDHISEENALMDEEEKGILKSIVTVEDSLLECLSNAQKEMLEIYNGYQNDLCAVCKEKAFVEGVVFATHFWREALGE